MLDMDGLADYDRQTGFVEGSVDLTWQTKKMAMDRGRQFTFDEQEVQLVVQFHPAAGGLFLCRLVQFSLEDSGILQIVRHFSSNLL